MYQQYFLALEEHHGLDNGMAILRSKRYRVPNRNFRISMHWKIAADMHRALYSIQLKLCTRRGQHPRVKQIMSGEAHRHLIEMRKLAVR